MIIYYFYITVTVSNVTITVIEELEGVQKMHHWKKRIAQLMLIVECYSRIVSRTALSSSF